MVTLHYFTVEKACIDAFDVDVGLEWRNAFGRGPVDIAWTRELQAMWMADPIYRRVIGTVLHFGLLPSWPAKVNARGLDLSNADFAGMRLGGSNFAQCTLTDASFARADLKHCNFRFADLRGSWFDDADTQHANFDGALIGMVSNLRGWVADENGIARRLQ